MDHIYGVVRDPGSESKGILVHYDLFSRPKRWKHYFAKIIEVILEKIDLLPFEWYIVHVIMYTILHNKKSVRHLKKSYNDMV